MYKQIRNRHFLLFDLLALPLAVYFSFVLRLEGFNIAPYGQTCLVMMGLVVVVIPSMFTLAGIYTRYWPYASVRDMMRLFVAVFLGILFASLAMWFAQNNVFQGIRHIPRSIPGILVLIALLTSAAPRLAIRVVKEYRRQKPSADGAKQRILIMGAGQAGSMIVDELRRNVHLGIEIAGFVDDDRAKLGLRIHGVRVLGNRQAIPDLARRLQVSRVVIAMPTAPGKTIREVVQICKQAGVGVKIMPGIYEILDGTLNVSQIRDVQIEDLLRREPIVIDVSAVAQLIRGKRVLVTGGGGSIGSELCRQLLHFEPQMLIVLGHGENSVFTACAELQRIVGALAPATAPQLASAIVDIRFAEHLKAVFECYHPDIVFHTAAHKHVPLMESDPAEAVANNVIGTRNLLDVSLATGVGRFVLISSDKAVNPSSVMGACKRAAELLVLQAARKSGRPYVAVRFGNVLGSRGSVVLTFKQQIATGGPITVTDPEMRRYFMTIPEAVQLVLQAAAIGAGGEIFTLDMGEPIRIGDLAQDMIRLSGLEVGRDIDIVITGRRPGEKLYEELFIKGEVYARTRHEKLFIAANASSFIPGNLDDTLQKLAAVAERRDDVAAVALLRALIPEYKPFSSASSAELAAQGQPPAAASAIVLHPG